MINGIFKNSSAMQLLENKFEVIGNNIANTSTNGFKRSDVFFQQMVEAEQALDRNKIKVTLPQGQIPSYTDYSPGAIKETGNKLDFALGSQGFFTIQSPDGIAYSRDGQFSINATGQLVNADGFLVLGEGGPIQLTSQEFSISDEGHIMVDGNMVNKFQIQAFNPNDGVRIKQGLIYPNDSDIKPVTIEKPSVQQGYLETSNVNVVKEMVEMIATQRYYEANNKVLRAQDESLAKSVNEIAR